MIIFGFGGLDIIDEGVVQCKMQLFKVWKLFIIMGVGFDK